MSGDDAIPEPWRLCSPNAPDAEAIRFDLAWRTSTVVSLAAGIVQDGNFDVMPILADALQDAGCDNTALLGHCRHGTAHAMDCWALTIVIEPNLFATQPRQPLAPRPLIVEAARMVDDLAERNMGFLFPLSLLCCFVFVLVNYTSAMVRVSLESTSGALFTMGLVFIASVSLVMLYLFYCVKLVRTRRRSRAER